MHSKQRALLVGAGLPGLRYLPAFQRLDGKWCELAGLVGSAAAAGFPNIPRFTQLDTALVALQPNVVIVTAPPPASLPLARQAARSGATVLVEPPVMISLAGWTPQSHDGRIFVALPSHFAPGLAGLIVEPPAIERAEVDLVCHQSATDFGPWQQFWNHSGGILHQHALAGIALAVRLLPRTAVLKCTGRRWHRRQHSPAEDAIDAEVLFTDGRRLAINARTDAPTDLHRRHELRLIRRTKVTKIAGRNLEAGLAERSTAPSETELRAQMLHAAANTTEGRAEHPSLLGLRDLPKTLEVITRVYSDCTVAR
ncbi:Predicted dehydrogenase [Saccharopolyspora antimicrobica]|uniref:Dehydrogenase n=2 Tax=Saccharopolyspora antimicrobica TaxID=455193 RepID=A0A1I5AW14_9PSEU|nr:putative dehydrogenase [Saccharopolyspora antimicrobica]SFN66571.1 Predicted dehydrogenase [Saccharopolyspora antimicrobica]